MKRRYFITLITGLLLLSACGKAHKSAQETKNVTPPVTSINTNPGERQGSGKLIDSLGVDGVVAVIRLYYSAINEHNYRQAYDLWENEGKASKQTFASFKGGFLKTDTVELSIGKPGRIEGAAGSRYIRIPVKLKATTMQGTVQRYAGQYVLRRTVVDGSTPVQRKWHIYSAHISRTTES